MKKEYILGLGAVGIAILSGVFYYNTTDFTNGGEYYRLLSCIFLHIGIMHLICNMYSLYILGTQMETFIGKMKFISVYFISGIVGALLSLALSGAVPSVGASGAIFGLLGAMLYFGYHYRTYLGAAIKQ